MLIMLRGGCFHILMPEFWTSFPNAGWAYACVPFILWLNVSSHRSFSLPCQLICCWLWFHLHSQSQACPQGSATSSPPVYSRVIKNLPPINIPISVLRHAPTGSLAAKEASDHLRISVASVFYRPCNSNAVISSLITCEEECSVHVCTYVHPFDYAVFSVF